MRHVGQGEEADERAARIGEEALQVQQLDVVDAETSACRRR